MRSRHSINMLYAFSLGFFSILLSFIVGLLVFVNALISHRFSKPSYKLLASTCLFLTFIFLYYIIGWDNLSGDSVLNRFIFLLVTTLLVALVSLKAQPYERIHLIRSFIFGMMIYAFGIVLISVIKGGYGYGLLYNPWTSLEMNSPSVSNDLALIAAFLILFKFNKYNLLRYILIFIVFISGIYVGGRTFVIIFLMSFIFSYGIKGLRNVIFTLPFVALFVVLLITTGISDVFLSRFYLMGLESARFTLIVQAMIDIPNYKYGGFSPWGELWFHNFYLDTASTSGWYPLITSVILTLFLSRILYTHYTKSLLFFFTCILLIMVQDVIMEANLKPFLLFILLSGLFCQVHKVKVL